MCGCNLVTPRLSAATSAAATQAAWRSSPSSAAPRHASADLVAERCEAVICPDWARSGSARVAMGRWRELKETWADLMWLESEAVVSTVILLIRSGVPSLPVHDSLIIPATAEACASDYARNPGSSRTSHSTSRIIPAARRCQNDCTRLKTERDKTLKPDGVADVDARPETHDAAACRSGG
jgi:hypothetical protein